MVRDDFQTSSQVTIQVQILPEIQLINSLPVFIQSCNLQVQVVLYICWECIQYGRPLAMHYLNR